MPYLRARFEVWRDRAKIRWKWRHWRARAKLFEEIVKLTPALSEQVKSRAQC